MVLANPDAQILKRLHKMGIGPIKTIKPGTTNQIARGICVTQQTSDVATNYKILDEI